MYNCENSLYPEPDKGMGQIDGYGAYFQGGYPHDDCLVQSALYLNQAGYPDSTPARMFMSCGSAMLPGPAAAPSPPLALEPNPETPLRVLYAGPCFHMGGVEQHANSLARFFNPKRARLAGYLVTNGTRPVPQAVERTPFPVRSCNGSELARAAEDCDVLLLWGEAFNGRLAPEGPLSVFVAHGESWWTRKTLEESNRVVDHVIAVSKRVEQAVCAGFPTTVIANGVDAGRLGQTRSVESVREQLGFCRDDFVIGSVGRFSREKRMHLLIDAVARLPRSFKLLLVGHGPCRAALLDQANECIPGRYAFVTAHDYLGDYYRAMDAFCLASAHEGFGLVIPEAMLCERPVIATSVGCVPDVLEHCISGLTVDPSAQAIAEAAALLHARPEWAQGLAREGQAFADRHLHAARMARDYENLLLRLHRDRTSARRAAS